VSVRFDADRPEEWSANGTVVWSDMSIDTAVLAINREGDEDEPEPVGFGRVSERDAVLTCSAMGFPRFKLRDDLGPPLEGGQVSQYRDSHHAVGTIAVLSNRREGTLEVSVSPPERDSDPQVSPWEGMSGAAVWSAGRIIGLIAEHHRSDGLGRLAATRVDRWYESLTPDQIGELHTLVGLPTLASGLAEVVPRPAGEALPGQVETALTALFQLPPDVPDFTGRERELEQLRQLLEPIPTDRSTAVVVSTISGKGGIGKTALAVRVAHELAASFADGQLYVDLRGIERQPLNPADVLAGFLRALGVEQNAIPDALEDRQSLYRSRLAGRRILVLLDNAGSEAQIRPLLPGSPTCAVIVTSRRPLATLEAAEQINLDILNPEEAVELLSRIEGGELAIAEKDAAREVVRLCGHLPLAVRIAGARLVARRHWRVADLVRVLGDERRRLRELRAGDLEVRASFVVSYDGQDTDHQRAFQLLGLLKATDFPAWTAAAVLDVAPELGEEILEDLCEAQLIDVAGRTASGATRYRFHDLLRDFARDCALEQEPAEARQAALERVFGGYLMLAERADIQLEPGVRNLGDGAARRWRADDSALVDGMIAGDPQGWFATERANLVIAVEQALEHRLWDITWELAGIFAAFFAVRVYPSEWEHTHLLALEATAASNDRRGEAFTRRSLGRLYRYQGRWEDAHSCYEWALAVFRELSERLWEGVTLRNLGDLHRDLGEYDQAIVDFNQGLHIFRELGNRQWQAVTLISLGEAYLKQGHHQQAIGCYERCLPIFEEAGHRWWRAVALVALGDVYHDQRRDEKALTFLGQGLEIFRELGDERRTTLTSLSLGKVYQAQGRYDEALAFLKQCLATFRRVSDRLWEARTLDAIGAVYQTRGDPESAREHWRQACEIFDAIRAPEGAQVAARLGA